MIRLVDASFTAAALDGDVHVLHPTTLSLTERRISLIGANGSGKSSLARLLNGLIAPTTGSVQVRQAGNADAAGAAAPSRNGQASHSGRGSFAHTDHERWLDTLRDGAAVRRQVGFVFTNPSAQLVMPTAIEDVALSLRRTHRDKQQRLSRARQVLERFGIDDLADRSVHALSGGQQQLLAIASVLAAEPRILVADEPTTLLDLRNSRTVSELLLGLPQQLIFATHDLDFAARADRTLVIEMGRVVFDGDPAEAVAHYRSLA